MLVPLESGYSFVLNSNYSTSRDGFRIFPFCVWSKARVLHWFPWRGEDAGNVSRFSCFFQSGAGIRLCGSRGLISALRPPLSGKLGLCVSRIRRSVEVLVSLHQL